MADDRERKQPNATRTRAARTLALGMLFGGCFLLGQDEDENEALQCSTLNPCQRRGEVCNLGALLCVPADIDRSATQRPAAVDFVQEIIPIHRGRACAPREVQAGEMFPIYVEPCVHPCLTVDQYAFRQSWSCNGPDCDAWVTMWMTVDALPQGCPQDAFANFDPNLCRFEPPIELWIDPVLANGSSVQGTMTIEVPFLTNTDAVAIAASDGDPDVIQGRIDQYPRRDNREVGPPVILSRSSNTPPVSCGERGILCDCSPIGF